MPGLNLSLLNALHALQTQQGALQATTNNIANANTPGYTRQIPVLVENTPARENSILYGTGASLQNFQSVRDQVLELLISQQTQQQASSDAQARALQQLQPVFTTTGQDLGSEMSAFFASLTKLSSDPTNMSLRENVLAAGRNLSNSFYQSVTSIGQIQSGLNGSVVLHVNQMNQLTRQIATLNAQLYQLRGLGQDGGALQDQQTELIRQLSQITGLSVIETENGETITTADGVALVVGSHQYDLQVSERPDGTQHIFSGSSDITSAIQGGKLGGELQVRDQVIPQILNSLDTLASELANAFNSVHAGGYDLKGDPGQNFFSVPLAVTGAASQIKLAISDPSLLAASSDGSAGSNGNLANLLAIRDQRLGSGKSPAESFSNLVFEVGTAVAAAESDSAASELTLQQLTNQRGALSGVSLDEESVNLIRYQQAYAAAARVVTTVDQLISVTLNMANGR